MSVHSVLKPCKQFIVIPVIMLLALAGSNNTIAQLDLKDIIKVQVTGPDGAGQAATGFLWQNKSQIVTSLHAVLHYRLQDRTMEVFCNGISTEASVDKVLIEADLVLLKAKTPVSGCTVFTDEFPQCKPDSLKPDPGTLLFTAGWKGRATTATDRNLIKARALGAETLRGLVSKQETMDAITKLKLPSLSLDIYLVKGDGLGGGYSGAPVVDKQRKLLGIVDGGMDKGATDYNWLVPATYLDCLKESQVKSLPTVDLTLLDAHFSAGLVEPGTETEITYTPKPGQQQVGSQYHFVKTKTRSLNNLIGTADKKIAEGIETVLQAHQSAVNFDAMNELRFDIFEDTDRNLIIAVPAGQGLVDGPLEEEPSVHMLRSDDINEKGFIQFEELVPDSEGYQVVKVANDGGEFFPEHNGFFDAFVEETMRVCKEEWDPDCRLDESSRWDTEFSDGNKVLTFGFQTKPTGDVVGVYFYYNVTVRDNDAFLAFAELPLWEDGNLIQCGSPGARCADNSTALLQLAQLVAANLTTFANE